jgi:hypothetical protein
MPERYANHLRSLYPRNANVTTLLYGARDRLCLAFWHPT